jgi:hypothetical protein
MPKPKSRKKKSPKRVLALPDLEHAKTAVLSSLASASEHAGHLSRLNRLYSDRLDQIRAQPKPAITSYDPARDEADDALLHMDLDASLERYAEDRRRLVARLTDRPVLPTRASSQKRHDLYSWYGPVAAGRATNRAKIRTDVGLNRR